LFLKKNGSQELQGSDLELEAGNAGLVHGVAKLQDRTAHESNVGRRIVKFKWNIVMCHLVKNTHPP